VTTVLTEAVTAHLPPRTTDADVAMPAHARTQEERMRSLARANQTRAARAALKNELATGRARIEEVLAHPPACATTAKVSDLLLAVHGVGPTRATRALARCQIPYAQTAAGLSERQRVALIDLLRKQTARRRSQEQS
jgi:predicted flap endonuclease-1-like 5' DNA nuclease